MRARGKVLCSLCELLPGGVLLSPQVFAWIVLGAVLVSVASGRLRPDLVALTGIGLLGATRVAPPEVLFSGFSHPAVITVAAVLVMSAAITASGALRGVGLALAHRTSGVRGQVLGLAAVTALLSAFMNNVGALGVTLPAAERMAERARVSPASFGMPLAQAGILGGTLTLIGSAPNLIISSYRASQGGTGFHMFSFLPHGMAALLAAASLWALWGPKATEVTGDPESEDIASLPEIPDVRRRIKLLAIPGAAVIGVATGLMDAPVGFTLAALGMVGVGILPIAEAYRRMNLDVIIFLAGMIGIGATLEHIGALAAVADAVASRVTGVPDPLLILAFLFTSSAISNAINNSAAAVFMGSLALSIAGSPAVTVGADALLMAVAAGSCMALILPTHQATVLAMARTSFAPPAFARSGLLLTVISGGAAALAIWLIW